MAKKRKRVPEVLWRLFNERARTLGDTIIDLYSNKTTPFLLRPDDPSEYRNLLTKCFAVVSKNAPPIQIFDPNQRWSQREIVTHSIEMILAERHSSLNLICDSYDKVKRSSGVVDELTSPAWSLLLRRVGDALMMYLLKHTSLFLPLSRKKQYQISGFPISDLCYKILRHKSGSKTQHQLPEYHGLMKKRKRVEGIEPVSGKRLCACSLSSEPFSNSISSVGSNGANSACNDQTSPKLSEKNPKQCTVLSRKHKRQYRWQRQRKRRQLTIQETTSLFPNHGNCGNSSNFSRGLQDGYASCSGQSIRIKISDFFHCLGSQNIRKMSNNAEIDRRNMLHRMENSTSMLPKKHIIYKLKPNEPGAILLFKNIFGTFDIDQNPQSVASYHSRSTCPIRSTCLYQSLVKLLKSLIRKTQNCRHLRLLDKHCPIKSLHHTDPEFEGNNSGTNLSMTRHTGTQVVGKPYQVANAKSWKTISDVNVGQVEPSNSYCPKKQVVSFIWAICRRIVPSPLLGTPSNMRVLRKNIARFIQLRKFEKFPLKQCMHKLKLSNFPLLSYAHCDNNGGSDRLTADIVRHTILKCWTFALFTCVVSPLIQANFYVTESECAKHEMLYYRKSTWEKMMGEAGKCLMDQRYDQLNHASARKILRKRAFGFSRVRLLPKHIGFRVLTNLQAPSRMRHNSASFSKSHRSKELPRKALNNCPNVKYDYFKSVNSVLHDSHVVLKGLRTKEPEKLGSSVFNYNDVYRKFMPFLLLHRSGSTTMPGVFAIVSDVSKAFDSVDQNKLLSVMKDVILDDEYTLERFIQVIKAKKSLKVHRTFALQCSIAESSNIRSGLPANSYEGILVKKEMSRTITRKEIYTTIEEHIKRNMVQFCKELYLQRVGIPQGSVLSILLCSYYYGHMEKNIIVPFLDKACEDFLGENDTPKYLLLRFVDDFLFISTSKRQASMFFSRLERGIREYNCCMNKEKYGLNFNMNHDLGCRSNRLHISKDGVSFLRWSGLLVNCSTLEIQGDYTRYLNFHLSSTLTVSCQGEVGRQLKEKLCIYLRPKCHPIFYDSNINSASVVRLNIYQAFLLCAMKFVCYISRLTTVPRFSPDFCINAIVASLRYMIKLIKKRMQSIEAAGFHPKFDVKKKEIIWLGLYAYSRVVKKKQSRYKELLRLLMFELKSYGKVDDISSELKYAIDDKHSSVLWGIKY